MASQYDLTIIGGGIVGLATALKILEDYPRTKLLILEKEPQLARHQTGNNSGVIHSGLYYRPGSLKARSCVAGRKALIEFCNENSVPYELCGKVVVATSQEELPRLDELHRRGVANGLQGLEIIGTERLKELEPHAIGIKGLRVPETGIIDYKKVAEAYASRVRAAGGDIRLSQRVLGIIEGHQEIVLQTSGGDYRTSYLINCCGLHSDIVAKMMKTHDALGNGDEHRIIPFRGEYYKIAPERQFLVRNLIYPVPDPTFPFLGVHFTRMAKGGVEAGPNASSRARARGLPPHPDQSRRSVENRFFQGLLGDGGKILADRFRRALPLPQQIRFRARAAKTCAGNSRERSCPRWRRRPCPGRVSQRRVGGRLCYQRKPQCHSRPQRPVPGRDSVLGHR